MSVEKRTWTCPPSRPVSAGPPPRYGMWFISICARAFSSSPSRWGSVPIPAEPKFSAPGRDFASAINRRRNWREPRMHGEHLGAVRNTSHRRECSGMVTQVLVDRRRDEKRARAAHQQRVAVRLRGRDRFDPIVPPAPIDRFSTITGCPRMAAILSDRSRAMTSGGPPAVDGTTSLIGRSGNACALCKPADARSARPGR